MTSLPQNPEVIVVGAGAAGLAAASALRAAKVDTLVLEAAPHTGGRCITDDQSFSVPFDRGGSWLHSAPINPLARQAEHLGVPLHKAPWRCARAHLEGRNLSAHEVAEYQNAQDGLWPAIDARGGLDPDVTTARAMPSGKWNDTLHCAIAQMLGGDADVTSAADSHNYADAKGDWLVGGGLGRFIQTLHADVPVKLNCPVTRIVTGIDTRRQTGGQNVRVTTPLGNITAKRLILTVSTGVLAAEHITFVPPLPATKLTAIDMLPNGLLNKVGLEFDPAWKDATQGQMADYHAGGDAFCALLFGFMDTPLAVGFIAGRCADALEHEGQGAATDFCLQGLEALYGSDARKAVIRTDETAWRSDSLALGSYSYARPGGTGARAQLAEPIDNRLFFAGEATMTHTYSTVHGAVQSGQLAAARVIASLNSERSL